MTVIKLYDYRDRQPSQLAGEFVDRGDGYDESTRERSRQLWELTRGAIDAAVPAAEVDPLNPKRPARAVGDLGRVGSAVPEVIVEPLTPPEYARELGIRLDAMRQGQKAA